jgi:CHASE3 domain sensor protein
MKIGGKIYAIVCLMGFVSVAIGGIAAYTINEYNATIEELEHDEKRVHLGERLNRYVASVAMEARGIYMSKSPEAAEP